MGFDVAPCMIKESETPDEKRERIRQGLHEIRLLKLKEFSTQLKEFSTPDLVRELCSREGVAEITFNRNDSCSSRCYGPGKILWVPDIIVVRGDE